MKEKHITFFELKDALLRGDCPICFLAERSVSRELDILFHEKVNDPNVAAELKRSGGFCEKHSEQILKTGETLGIAIIYQRLINHLIAQIKKTNFSLKLTPCPLCKTYSEAENRYIHAMLDHWGELRDIFRSSSILCVDHAQKALEAAGKRIDIKKEIFEIEISKLHELSSELEEYCRKFDYRFKNEKWGKEKDVWQRALKIVEFIPKEWRKHLGERGRS